MSSEEARASIPKWHEFIDPVIRVLGEHGRSTLQEIYARVADRVGLTEAAKAELTTSARQPVYWNRIGWAITRSKGAGLIAQPARATYELTQEGRSRALEQDALTEVTLREYPEYREWISTLRSKRRDTVAAEEQPQSTTDVADELTPTDRIDEAVTELDAALEQRIYEALLQIESPYDFERIVTDFVARLGYGSEFTVTARSGDLGVDGIVMRDILGLERVYVQAKRYAEGNMVSAEAVRAFIGSLGLHRASIGVMITTSRFANTSHAEVERTHSTHIRLIDGRELARLMVKHGIGVSVERTIEIKRIDTDKFFGAGELG